MCVCVCVCEREREGEQVCEYVKELLRKRERQLVDERERMCLSACLSLVRRRRVSAMRSSDRFIGGLMNQVEGKGSLYMNKPFVQRYTKILVSAIKIF